MTGFSNTDFDAIEAAVMNTARGRWFLTEHARRNRAADTHTLLEAIRKLESGLGLKGQKAVPPEAVAEIDEVVKSLSIAKVELSTAASEITGEVTSRRVLDALVRLANAEERLEAFVGQQASRIASANTGAPALTPENLSYFREDEELFAAPTRHKAEPVAIAQAPMVATRASTRRAVVARALPLETAAADPRAQVTAEREMPEPEVSSQSTARPRILVVRSRPSEETRIPLEEEPGAIAH